MSLAQLAWSPEDLGRALEALVQHAGFSRAARHVPSPPVDARLGKTSALDAWLESASAWAGCEAESVQVTYGDVDDLLRFGAPALLRVGKGEAGRFFLLIGSTRTHVRLLGGHGEVGLVARAELRDAVVAELEAPHRRTADACVSVAALRDVDAMRVRKGLLARAVGEAPIRGIWLLRPGTSESLFATMFREGIAGAFARVVALAAVQTGVVLGAWRTLVDGALSGRFDAGWLSAWGLLLASAALLHAASTWSEITLGLAVGRALKRRLLEGALRLSPESVRRSGAGRWLARVIEAESIEGLLSSGGLAVISAVLELLVVTGAFAETPQRNLAAGGLLLWVVATLAMAAGLVKAKRAATKARLALTSAMTERMLGHRTRLAQLDRSQWHDGEDALVNVYLASQRRSDRASLLLAAAVGGAWTLFGLLALVPIVLNEQLEIAAWAWSIGAVLFVGRSLAKLAAGVVALGDVVVAWDVVRDLLRAATEEVVVPDPAIVHAPRDGGSASPLLDASAIRFRHESSQQSILDGVDLRMHRGDRVLLEGRSGGGKSTLAAVLAGQRDAASGLLLLSGLDRASLGTIGWRRRIAAVPQFHENHVLSGSLAFNVLLGGEWPPTADRLAKAEEVCRELGLGALIDRMPSGMAQQVGESGWQLSHGERSRLYIARALLQDADVVVLDESFGALDPDNVGVCVEACLRRTDALLVVAHP